MKVLIVLTSHSDLGKTGQKTGFWIEEFAAPFYVLQDAGVEITLASPKGGQPPIDPKSAEPVNQTDATRRFDADKDLQELYEKYNDKRKMAESEMQDDRLFDLALTPHQFIFLRHIFFLGNGAFLQQLKKFL